MHPLLLHGFGTSVRVNGRTLEIDRRSEAVKRPTAPSSSLSTSVIVDSLTGSVSFEAPAVPRRPRHSGNNCFGGMERCYPRFFHAVHRTGSYVWPRSQPIRDPEETAQDRPRVHPGEGVEDAFLGRVNEPHVSCLRRPDWQRGWSWARILGQRPRIVRGSRGPGLLEGIRDRCRDPLAEVRVRLPPLAAAILEQLRGRPCECPS